MPHYLLGVHLNITYSKALLTTPSEAARPPRHPKMKMWLSRIQIHRPPSILSTDLKTLNKIMNNWTAHLTSWSGTEQRTRIRTQSLRQSLWRTVGTQKYWLKTWHFISRSILTVAYCAPCNSACCQVKAERFGGGFGRSPLGKRPYWPLTLSPPAPFTDYFPVHIPMPRYSPGTWGAFTNPYQLVCGSQTAAPFKDMMPGAEL